MTLRSWGRFTTGLMLLAFASGAAGQELRLSDRIAEGLANNREIAAAQKRYEAARQRPNVSREGPLDSTVTTSEKSGWFRGGSRQFHFQLQQPLKEDLYSALWRRVNRSKDLTFLDSAATQGEIR